MNPDAEKEIPKDNCGMEFRNEMVGKDFGYYQTLDAWYWFRNGWKAALQPIV